MSDPIIVLRNDTGTLIVTIMNGVVEIRIRDEFESASFYLGADETRKLATALAKAAK